VIVRAGAVEPEPASGTLVFLFTDVEGSTRLWERFPQAMQAALERHDRILEAAVAAAGGQVVKTTGDGMMAVFSSAAAAVGACLTAQRDLAAEPWGPTGPLRVRMGLHAGEAATRSSDYFGPAVNRTARIMAVGHGSQVLLSAAAAALATVRLPEGAELRDLGTHRLKDLGRPERLFQLVHPDLADAFPPLATLDRHPNNLPTQTSTFVGRDAELEEIDRRLGDAAVRLLTLTGPGGTGKTRLALRAAADQVDQFEDGVFLVDLSAVRATEDVPAAIARAVGLSETGGQPMLEELKERLRGRQTLLVLDNFEQVTTAGPMAVELLEDCPGLKLLVTSREALRVRPEHLFPVPPLSLPGGAAGHRSAAELAGCEAAQLFAERAQAVRADFRLTDENADAVAGICRRLDGLPLAIELATARLNLFSPEALRDRLGSRLGLLRGGPRDLPARQQTLRATIEWSYQLLEAGEQRLFELLSVFSGAGFEAVEVVAAELDRLTGTELDVLDGLASLVDKSLVRQADTGAGEPRVVMLETIGEYAAERLDDLPELAAAARRAHAAFFADLARRQWEHLTGQRREQALVAMTTDLDNLRLAWDHWVAANDLDQLNKLVDSLWLLYDARGWYHDTVRLTTDLLEVLSSSPSTPDRVLQEVTLRTSLAQGADGDQGLHARGRGGVRPHARAVRGAAGPPAVPGAAEPGQLLQLPWRVRERDQDGAGDPAPRGGAAGRQHAGRRPPVHGHEPGLLRRPAHRPGAPRHGHRPLPVRAVPSGPLPAGQQPGRGLPHQLGVHPLGARPPRPGAGTRRRGGRRGRRAGASPHPRLRAVPRRLPASLAARARARP
jgi:predicted ATPase/class 3 adenylate cyclase